MNEMKKRPSTSYSYRRSGCLSPAVSWGEESLQVNWLDVADQIMFENGKISPKLEDMMQPNSAEIFADVSPKDCNDKCKGMKNRGDGVNDPENFYLTSHKKDFKGYPGQPSSFLRPESTWIYPQGNRHFTSSYQEHFPGHKGFRSGIEKKDMRNNPHPLQRFMIWRIPSRRPMLEAVEDVSKESLKLASNDSFRSTYQVNHQGIPLGGHTQEDLRNCYPRLKSANRSYTLDSISRSAYQKPRLEGNLKISTTRYGSNTQKHIPSIGAVPNISKLTPTLHRQNTTSYADEFIDKSEHVKFSRNGRPNVTKRLNQDLFTQRRSEREGSF